MLIRDAAVYVVDADAAARVRRVRVAGTPDLGDQHRSSCSPALILSKFADRRRALARGRRDSADPGRRRDPAADGDGARHPGRVRPMGASCGCCRSPRSRGAAAGDLRRGLPRAGQATSMLSGALTNGAAIGGSGEWARAATSDLSDHARAAGQTDRGSLVRGDRRQRLAPRTRGDERPPAPAGAATRERACGRRTPRARPRAPPKARRLHRGRRRGRVADRRRCRQRSHVRGTGARTARSAARGPDGSAASGIGRNPGRALPGRGHDVGAGLPRSRGMAAPLRTAAGSDGVRPRPTRETRPPAPTPRDGLRSGDDQSPGPRDSAGCHERRTRPLPIRAAGAARSDRRSANRTGGRLGIGLLGGDPSLSTSRRASSG